MNLQELADAEKNLADRIADQERMKAVNAIIRKGVNVEENLKELGLSTTQIQALINPTGWDKKQGYKTWELTNNNQNIGRLRERVNMLNEKFDKFTKGKEERFRFEEFGGGEFFINRPIDRVQILFDAVRVPEDVYAKMRKNGYVFSPSNKAFQRKITPSAISTSKYLLKIDKNAQPIDLDLEEETKPKYANGQNIYYLTRPFSIVDSRFNAAKNEFEYLLGGKSDYVSELDIMDSTENNSYFKPIASTEDNIGGSSEKEISIPKGTTYVGASNIVNAAIKKGNFAVIVKRNVKQKDIQIGENVLFVYGGSNYNNLIKAFNETELDPNEYKIVQITTGGYSYQYPFDKQAFYAHRSFEREENASAEDNIAGSSEKEIIEPTKSEAVTEYGKEFNADLFQNGEPLYFTLSRPSGINTHPRPGDVKQTISYQDNHKQYSLLFYSMDRKDGGYPFLTKKEIISYELYPYIGLNNALNKFQDTDGTIWIVKQIKNHHILLVGLDENGTEVDEATQSMTAQEFYFDVCEGRLTRLKDTPTITKNTEQEAIKSTWIYNHLKDKPSPYGIDNLLSNFIKTGSIYEPKEKYERVINNPAYSKFEQLIRGLKDYIWDYEGKMKTINESLERWVHHGQDVALNHPKYKEDKNEVAAFEYFIKVLNDIIAEFTIKYEKEFEQRGGISYQKVKELFDNRFITSRNEFDKIIEFLGTTARAGLDAKHELYLALQKEFNEKYKASYSNDGNFLLIEGDLEQAKNDFLFYNKYGSNPDRDISHIKSKFESEPELNITKNTEQKMIKILLGKLTTIKLANGEQHEAQYAIANLSDVLASHNEKTFASTIGFPTDVNGRNINDRNYQVDVQAQSQVIEYARNLQPDRLITNAKTPSGMPIVVLLDENNKIFTQQYMEELPNPLNPVNIAKIVVVSGNNRAMSVKLAKSDYPANYSAYRAELMQELTSYGYYEEEVAEIFKKFEDPFIFRIDYSLPALNTQEMAKFNQDTKKSKRPIDKAIELSNILRENEGCRNAIAQILSEYENMSDFYSNAADQKRVVDYLVKCSIITEQGKPEYYSIESGFTANGKLFLEAVLSAIVLNSNALQISEVEGVKKMRQVLITSLPVLMQNAKLSKGTLLDDINSAIVYQNKVVNSGLKFSNYIYQIDAFDTEKVKPTVLAINRLLDAGQRKFKAAISKYNDTIIANIGNSFFGDDMQTSPEEAFEAYIVGSLDDDSKKHIEKYAALNGFENANFPIFDADGVRSIKDADLDKMEKYLDKQPQTKSMYFKDGKYTPERQVLHDEIINKEYGNPTCRKTDKPIAIMTGGLPGSGKSTFLKNNYNWALNPSIFKIDADEIRSQLPEYDGWNANVTHEETQDIVKKLINLIAPEECKFDFIYDGTMTNYKKYKQLMGHILSLGYEIYGIFLQVSQKDSLERMLGRYKRSGRFVPRSVIYENSEIGSEAFKELQSMMTGWILVDGISQKVISKGGKELPANRNYGKLDNTPTPAKSLLPLIDKMKSILSKMDKIVTPKGPETILDKVKVGDVLYSSWGYDQTNVDFYKIVEKTPKSVIVVEIKGDYNYGDGYGAMAGKVSPLVNEEVNGTKIRVGMRKDGNNFNKLDGHYLSIYTKPVYFSQYA